MISPAEKLSVTEMLKKRMREEEMAKEKPKRRRRSSVFKEHEESRARVCELRAAPGCTTVSWPTRSNFQFYPTLPRSSLLWLLPAWSLSVRACVLHSWKHRLAKESKPQSWEGWGVRHNKMQPEATQVDGPQELKGDFCSCSPVHLFLLNKGRKNDFMC